MGFNAEVKITGLCAYVPDEKLNSPYVRPSRMTVFLPNAGTKSILGRALDGGDLRKHYPVLKFNSKDLEDRGDMPDDSEVQWHVEGMEITFAIEPPCTNEFEVYQDLSKPRQIDRDEKDFNWGASLAEIAPKCADIDPKVFSEFLGWSACPISARVVIDKGYLFTRKLNPSVDWKLGKSLGGTLKPRPLSNEVALKFSELDRLVICARPFGKGQGDVKKLTLVGRGADPMLLEIGNLCENCLFPPLPDDAQIDLDQIRRDEDFRWYYELSSQAGQIPSMLRKRASLPVPVPAKIKQGGGSRLVECMRVTFNAYKVPKDNSQEGANGD